MTDDEKQRAQISAEVFGESAGTPPDEAKPELKSEPQAEPVVEPTAPVVDEWAGVSPALRARMEQMEASLGEFGTVKERLQQAERRVGALTNELHEAKKKPEPVKEEPVESERVKKFREDYPEINEPIEERIAAIRTDILSKVPAIDEKSLAETIKKTLKDEIAFELAVERVEEAHPGWQQTKETPEFRAWQKTASADVQKLAMSARAVDAIRMFDAFVDFKKGQKSPAQIEADRLKRLEQAQSPEGRKLQQPKAESDMTPAELRAHIAAQVFAKP